MKVTGFTIVKNAVKFDFPVVEAIKSILPLCTDFIVAVGDSDDNTRELISGIDKEKIKIINTVWNKDLNTGGEVLADETNKAFQAIGPDVDWCFYIQADEILHEKYLDIVYGSMEKWRDDKNVDGLLFKYLHFYGSYDYVATSSNWYKREIRVIRNDKSFYSYRDAQGFRKANNKKLSVKEVDAFIYHYGWVREPKKMNAKLLNAGKIYGGEDFNEDLTAPVYSGDFDYNTIDALNKFEGTHPEVMKKRINQKNWKFSRSPEMNKTKFKELFKNAVERLTGKRPFDYKNYNLLK